MKQIFLTLWVATCILRLTATAADSTNASAGVEWLSEVISLKHAGASDVAEALNYLSGRGGLDPNRVKPFLRRADISLDRQLSDTTKTIADLRSNSVLIFASQWDLESIRRIVAKLDVARKQILIDAAIFEVRLPNGRNARGDGPGRLPAAAADHFLGDDVSWVADFVPVVGGLEGFSYVAGLSNEFNAMVTSLLRDGGTNVDIIQRPRFLTADGMPRIIFGEPIFPHAVIYSTGEGHYYTPANYQQSGLGLVVTPTINAEGLIAVELKASFSKVDGKTHISGVGDVPTTSTSEARASVVLRDGDVLLIGGANGTAQKFSSGRQPQSELMVLLRATVISDSSRTPN